MKRTLMYAAALVLLSNCNTLANLHIINPTYQLRGVQPRVNLGIPPTMDFDFVVGVDNPNPVELRLDHFDFDMLINNNRVLNNVRSDQGIHIPARGVGDVHLTGHVSYDNLRTIFNELANVVQDRKS